MILFPILMTSARINGQRTFDRWFPIYGRRKVTEDTRRDGIIKPEKHSVVVAQFGEL